MKTTKMVVIIVLALGLAAEVAKADFTFGTPTNLGPTINSSSVDVQPEVSANGLELYFTSERTEGYGGGDIWVTRRETIEDSWGTLVNLGPTVNSSYSEASQSISADGLTLYFDDYPNSRPGGVGGVDIWVTTRPTVSDPWGTPVNLGSVVNSGARDASPSISADGLALFLYSNRSGGYGSNDIWVARRPTTSDPWDTPVNLGPPVNTSSGECCPSISADGRMLFFGSSRSGSAGYDLWVTTRATVSDSWGPPVNLGPTVNSSSLDDTASISADGSTLYFVSNRPGGVGNYDLWQVSISPVVDFNGDGIVNSADMCLMVDHWHTDEPFYDIGPTPFGDGIVDVQDLIVLAEHLFEEPGLIAYWNLDETEGDIAYDSANDNDGTVYGDPAWQPEGGMVDGALQLDGIGDYVSTPFVLNPADGAFSVFAWIKGGAAGQVVIAQKDGVNWLCADSLEGNLMTELKGTGRGAAALLSQTNIADGNWHRVAFVWDGAYRTLYVDDVEVAKDTQEGLEPATGVLYIGTDTAMEAGTYWSGLIDDVRIYDRVVIPMESLDTSREVNVDENDDGSQVELEQGQILVVTLESNPTTGYGWEVAEIQESILEQMGEAEFKPSDEGEPPITGAGGWEIFRFKAISAGQMTLQLVYRISWDESAEPINTFSIEVVVN